MIDLSIFTELAIKMGAIQHPPLADVKEINAPNFGAVNEPNFRLVSQSNETNLIIDDLTFAFEERAAILEYDGGWPRAEAERLARLEIYGQEKAT